jgi:hypothetical protein
MRALPVRALSLTIIARCLVLTAAMLVTAPTHGLAAVLWYSGDLECVHLCGVGGDFLTVAKNFQRLRVNSDSGWIVTDIWSNNFDIATTNRITMAEWSIRTDMAPDSRGKVVSQGLSPVSVTPTGRGPPSLPPEYTVKVSGLSVYLPQGDYWANVTPFGTVPHISGPVPLGAASVTLGTNSVNASSLHGFLTLISMIGDPDQQEICRVGARCFHDEDISMGISGRINVIPEPGARTFVAIALAMLCFFSWLWVDPHSAEPPRHGAQEAARRTIGNPGSPVARFLAPNDVWLQSSMVTSRWFCARSRDRTGMACLRPRDFKSLVSTNFTIRAQPSAGKG